jgi:uncharacterized membrane protein
MPFLSVWKWDSPGGAAGAGTRIDTLAKEGAAKLVDAAMVEWADTQPSPQTTQLMGRFAKGTMGKAFWADLFAEVLSEGGSGGAPSSLEPFGLDQPALSQLRREVTQGCSLLFLIADQGDRERMVEAFGGGSREVRLIYSDLPTAEEAALRDAFTDP